MFSIVCCGFLLEVLRRRDGCEKEGDEGEGVYKGEGKVVKFCLIFSFLRGFFAIIGWEITKMSFLCLVNQ